jgi:hypothetical protein
VLIQRQVRHQPLQSVVLFFQLPEAAEFTDAEVRVFLLPRIERLLGDPELATEVADRRACFGLARA